MFLSGTLLNIATVLIGTTLGLLVGRRMPERMQQSLTALSRNRLFPVIG